MNEIEFIVGKKNKAFAFFSKLVPTAVIRMADADRFYGYRTDFKCSGACIQIFDLGFYIIIFYRKVRRGHDFGKYGFHKITVKRASVH